jgi:acetyl-CoA acetyltransferase
MPTQSMHQGNVAIVGASETTRVGVIPDMSIKQLHADGIRNALRDAGLTAADVDGIATSGGNRAMVIDLGDMFGIRPRWVDGTSVGGCSFMIHVRHAAAAIASGAADVVLVSHAESGRSRVGVSPLGAEPQSLAGQFEHPFGALAPFQNFTLPAMAFLESRGMTRRDLAEVVVAQREWAIPNERAMRRKPTTVDEVLDGPPIAYPFTRDMCCLVSDGGGALILTSAERAKDLPSADRAVYILGSGESVESSIVSQMDDITSSGAFRRSSKEAFQTAGITHADVDHVMFYDAFAHVPLYMLEDTGFVGRGESGAFFAEGHTRPGGKLPINTQGGGMSYVHTGMYSMFAMQEAIRQLRGEAVVQVPEPTISFVQGVGGFFWAAASLVFTNRRP